MTQRLPRITLEQWDAIAEYICGLTEEEDFVPHPLACDSIRELRHAADAGWGVWERIQAADDHYRHSELDLDEVQSQREQDRTCKAVFSPFEVWMNALEELDDYPLEKP